MVDETKLLQIIESMEDYARDGEEYPDPQMLLDWARKLRGTIKDEETTAG